MQTQVPNYEKGKVTVFQNLTRNNAPIKLQELLSEVNPGGKKLNWTFSYYKNEDPEVNEENLKVIPEVPKEYRDPLMQEQELDNMMRRRLRSNKEI